jgi:hypothetical protein
MTLIFFVIPRWGGYFCLAECRRPVRIECEIHTTNEKTTRERGGDAEGGNIRLIHGASGHTWIRCTNDLSVLAAEGYVRGPRRLGCFQHGGPERGRPQTT